MKEKRYWGVRARENKVLKRGSTVQGRKSPETRSCKNSSGKNRGDDDDDDEENDDSATGNQGAAATLHTCQSSASQRCSLCGDIVVELWHML